MTRGDGVIVKVVCTGGGRHGEQVLYELTVTASAITQVTFRRGKSPLSGPMTALEDGELVTGDLHHRAILPAPSARESLGAPWRRRCRSCKQDWPLADETVREWAKDSPTTTLDVSARRNVSDP